MSLLGDLFGLKKKRRKFVTVRSEDVAFFKKHAGSAHHVGQNPKVGRVQGAVRLAKAERAARERGYNVNWEHDRETWDPGDTDYVPSEVLCASLINPTTLATEASLCSIADPDRNYRRVVEAELALEAGLDRLAQRPLPRRRRR